MCALKLASSTARGQLSLQLEASHFSFPLKMNKAMDTEAQWNVEHPSPTVERTAQGARSTVWIKGILPWSQAPQSRTRVRQHWDCSEACENANGRRSPAAELKSAFHQVLKCKRLWLSSNVLRDGGDLAKELIHSFLSCFAEIRMTGRYSDFNWKHTKACFMRTLNSREVWHAQNGMFQRLYITNF